MLNLGALVHYAKGDGGVALQSQLPEPKRNSSTSQEAPSRHGPAQPGRVRRRQDRIAGANLVCTPIDIHAGHSTRTNAAGSATSGC
jgi:hypothetical protein